jgi:signal recognition particle receptor subunit beta
MSKKELMSLLGEEELYGVPLIVFANKADLSMALPVGEIGKTMGLSSIRDREWKLQRSSAFTGEGLDDGMKWLTDCLRNSKN